MYGWLHIMRVIDHTINIVSVLQLNRVYSKGRIGKYENF